MKEVYAISYFSITAEAEVDHQLWYELCSSTEEAEGKGFIRENKYCPDSVKRNILVRKIPEAISLIQYLAKNRSQAESNKTKD